MVAAHDAGELEGALSRGLARAISATALLNWVSRSRSAVCKQRTPNIMKLAAMVNKRSVRRAAALSDALCGNLWKLRSPMAAALSYWERKCWMALHLQQMQVIHQAAV